MTSLVDFALLAGDSYYDTRADINRFPLPDGWSLYSRLPENKSSGFEASAYKCEGKIVISYAGTYPGDIFGDLVTDLALAAGVLAKQLCEAAEYYLQVKALNRDASITLTGHSLGGGLASLIAVFFGESATTFDQAPFLRSALTFNTDSLGNPMTNSVAMDLQRYLVGKGYNRDDLAPLNAFIAASDPFNPDPISGDTLNTRGQRVTKGVRDEWHLLKPKILNKLDIKQLVAKLRMRCDKPSFRSEQSSRH